MFRTVICTCFKGLWQDNASQLSLKYLNSIFLLKKGLFIAVVFNKMLIALVLLLKIAVIRDRQAGII